MATFFKSQADLSKALKEIIDGYWSGIVDENQLIHQVNDIINKNKYRYFNMHNEPNSIVLQRLGKRRIQLIESIIKTTQGGSI